MFFLIRKLLFPANTLKGKIIRIEHDIKEIVLKRGVGDFWLWRFGVYNINPKHLAIWVCVKDDITKENLKSDIELIPNIKNLFYKHGYPSEAVEEVYVGIESQETVDRQSKGNWYLHLK